MKKLALSDELLLSVEKPARYIGSEINSVQKDPEAVGIRFAICFPDVYEIGMSHLGIQILYEMFNRREDVWCERVYSPWVDLDRLMRDPVRDVLYEHFADPGLISDPHAGAREGGRRSLRDRGRPLRI